MRDLLKWQMEQNIENGIIFSMDIESQTLFSGEKEKKKNACKVRGSCKHTHAHLRLFS